MTTLRSQSGSEGKGSSEDQMCVNWIPKDWKEVPRKVLVKDIRASSASGRHTQQKMAKGRAIGEGCVGITQGCLGTGLAGTHRGCQRYPGGGRVLE